MKRNVRLFSMLLAILCMVSMIPMTTVSAESNSTAKKIGLVDLAGYNDGATYTDPVSNVSYTVVKTYDTLKSLKSMTGNIILGNDIDFSSGHFQITLNGYTLDGNGFAMYGISFTNKGSGFSHFIVGAATGNVLKNLDIGTPENHAQMTGTATSKQSGVLFSKVEKQEVTIENVTVYADVTVTQHHCGGFVGQINTNGVVTINNSRFYGTMTETKNYPIGGFVGDMRNGGSVTITNSSNYGTIKNGDGTNVDNTAGFIGCVIGTSKATIENCVNYGEIIGNCATSGNIGGFVGYLKEKASATIKSSLNAGKVSGYNAGGFVGCNDSSVQNSIDDTSLAAQVTIEKSMNTGYIEGVRSAAGLLCWVRGQYTLVTFTESVNFGKICATGADGEAAGLVHQTSNYTKIKNCASFGIVSVATAGKPFGLINAAGWTPKQEEGLYGIELSGSKGRSIPEANRMTVAEGVTWFNNKTVLTLVDTFGKLIMNTDGTGAVLAAPTFAGVQEHKTSAGNIRLVATLGDSLNYSAVGFEVELVDGNTITKECNSVYQKLLSSDEQGFASEVTAADLYGTYIFALAIENIPTTGTWTLKITPYGKDLNKVTVYSGDSYSVTITDGRVVGIKACA